MWMKTGDSDYVLWEKVVIVSFEKHEGLIVGANLQVEGRIWMKVDGAEYARAIWERMFPTRPPHDIL